MANHVELKYSDIKAYISVLNKINEKLEYAYKQLHESTDLGSTAMQATWSFGSKKAIFNALSQNKKDIKRMRDVNEDLMAIINSLDDSYEKVAKKSKKQIEIERKVSKILDDWINKAKMYIPPQVPNRVINWWSTVPIVSVINNVIQPNIEPGFIPQIIPTFDPSLVVNVDGKQDGMTNIVDDIIDSINDAKEVVDTTIENSKPNFEKGQVLSDIWRDWGPVSPNGFTNYNGKGNCTWYADQRWSQLNPDYPLKFTNGSKNAGQWDDRIDRNYFNVNTTGDSNNIVSNAIAVSESGTYGHVAFIEQVKDGMVYFTEDGESYTRPNTWTKDANGNWIGPSVQCLSVAEFQKRFPKIITKK